MENKPPGSFLLMNIKQLCFMAIGFASLMTLVVTQQNVSPWITTPIVLLGIVLVVGWLFSLILKIKTTTTLEYTLYSIGLGLSFLLLGGLGINWILPHVGVVHPLGRIPLIIFFDVSILILSFLVYIFNKDYSLLLNFKWPSKTSLFFGFFPIVFLILSVAGSSILNNGGTGIVTLCMLFGIALYVMILMLWKKEMGEWVYPSALYSISLSLLLMYSLRSGHILGWDINAEYQVFHMSLQNLVWKMSYFPGLDYNACLSITILPTIFKVLTNTSSEYVFKVIFQILFAVTPVMLYALARRFLARPFSFLAAFLFLSQTWFFEQMPGLIRQETAFIFYFIILLVLFDNNLSSRIRNILFYVFTVTLVASHYSTSYIWFALMLGVLALSYTSRYFIPSLRKQSMIVAPLMFFASIGFLLIWEISITHTGQAITNFVMPRVSTPLPPVVATTTLQKNNTGTSTASTTPVIVKSTTTSAAEETPVSVLNTLKNTFMRVFFLGNNSNNAEDFSIVEEKLIKKYGAEGGYSVYPDSDISLYIPELVDDRVYVDNKVPQLFSDLIALLVRLSKFLLINIFPLIGIAGLYFKFYRSQSNKEGDFVILNTVAYALIVLMLFIPYLQIFYNFTRLYLQMFFTLSIFAIIGGIIVTKYFGRYQTIVLSIMAVIIFCSLSGAFDQLMGGQTRITLNQVPAIHDTYYIYDAEVAGAHWLAQNRDTNAPVQADIIANLRLQSFANLSAQSFTILPQTLIRDAYVYLVDTNITKNSTFYLYENNLLTYNYPLEFADTHKDLIYNSGSSRIYK